MRSLAAIFLALAVLCSPALARAEIAFAGTPDHEQIMDSGGHCEMPPNGPVDHGKAQGKSCCFSISMAATIEPAVPLFEKAPDRAPATSSNPAFHLGQLSEIAAPPPRQA